jgi:ribose 5-phosphate isomerase A
VTVDLEVFKQQAAERALDLIESGMVVGLGTGSTAKHMLKGLAARLRDGRLRDIVGVPTSIAAGTLARELGIPLATLEQHSKLDIALDGADEIDPKLNLIKGLGGALLYEKIVETCTDRLIIMADETKIVKQLGTRSPLPVEVIPLSLPLVTRRLRDVGCEPVLRMGADQQPYRTDENNYILDCHFSAIENPEATGAAIKAIPGVVEHGLFLGMAVMAFVAGAQGVQVLRAS